jgi:hypothetical protein
MNQIDETDPFLQMMFSRMSPGARDMFSAYQLDEIRRVFSARTFGTHAVEFRRSVGLFGKSYYVVFLAGRERRSRAQTGARVPGTLLLLVVIAVVGYVVYTRLF